jgi:hypothetical protein
LNVQSDFIHELINSIFIKEFNADVKSHIISKIYSMKFLIYFRLQIPYDWLEGILQMVIKICSESSQKVLNDAGLLTLEKILYMKDIKETNKSTCEELFKKEDLYMNVLKCLTDIIVKNQDGYAMKCFFRTIFLTDQNILLKNIKSFASITNHIIGYISEAKDSKEQYSYYFFEAIAIILTKLFKKDTNAYKYFANSIQNKLISLITSSNIEIMLG